MIATRRARKLPGIARYIRNITGWRGDVRLYKLDPPVNQKQWEDEEETAHSYEYVLVSAVISPISGPETFIFPSDENGVCQAFIEMDGSLRGTMDHETALRGAGYTARSPNNKKGAADPLPKAKLAPRKNKP